MFADRSLRGHFFLGVREVKGVKEVRDISIHYQEPDD